MANRFKISYRLSAIAAVVGAAACSNAWTINFGGTYTNPYTPFEQLNILYTYSDLLGTPTVINYITYSYVTGVSSTGTLGASGHGAFFADFSGGDVAAGGTHTMYGTWTALPGTIAGIKPTGTYAATFDGIGDFNFSFVGQPVPEPTSFAVVGIGVCGLLVRRRKKS